MAAPIRLVWSRRSLEKPNALDIKNFDSKTSSETDQQSEEDGHRQITELAVAICASRLGTKCA